MKKLILCNWKMNLDAKESVALSSDIVKLAKKYPDFDLAVIPSFNVMSDVASVIGKSVVGLGAQNCFWEERGAYTGEVSARDLKELGCRYVLLGHTERRQYLKETDMEINSKVKTVLKNRMTPVLCVGETLTEREEGRWAGVLDNQLMNALKEVELVGNDELIIAYEPVWAIGTGRACEPQAAAEVHALIRNDLYERFGLAVAKEHFRVVYGGSVTAKNIAAFFNAEGVDGALAGGASLKTVPFSALLSAAQT